MLPIVEAELRHGVLATRLLFLAAIRPKPRFFRQFAGTSPGGNVWSFGTYNPSAAAPERA